MTEAELVAGCRRRDRNAQRQLYEQSNARVFRLLLRLTGSPIAAEDLVQETYLKAFSAVTAFDARSSLSTWLYRIAINEALQWMRRKSPVGVGTVAAHDRPDPHINGHAAGTRMDVETAIAALEPLDRAMLLLRYQEGLDYASIAAATEIAIGTVGSRLNRARQRIRALLIDYAPAAEENAGTRHQTSRDDVGAHRNPGAMKDH